VSLVIRIVLVFIGVTIVVYLAFVLLLTVFPDFGGDIHPPEVVLRNETRNPVVIFLCDDAARLECRDRGWALNPRSTTGMYVTDVVPKGSRFAGEIVATSQTCDLVASARFSSDGGAFAIVVDDHSIDGRNDISPYAEKYAPGFSQQGIAPRTSCPDLVLDLAGGRLRGSVPGPSLGTLAHAD
jgi:hypothetical protein